MCSAGGEEAQELKKAIPFEIIPGISSSVAGPAYAGFLLHTVIVVLS